MKFRYRRLGRVNPRMGAEIRLRPGLWAACRRRAGLAGQVCQCRQLRAFTSVCLQLRAFASVFERARSRFVAFGRVWSRLVAPIFFFRVRTRSGTFGCVLSSFLVISRHSSSFFVPKWFFSGMAGNGLLRQRLGREVSSLLRVAPPRRGQDVHYVMIFVSNWFATAAGPRLRWFVLRTIVLQNRGVCSSLYSQGCIPDYCASSKAKRLKQPGPGLTERSRAACRHRQRPPLVFTTPSPRLRPFILTKTWDAPMQGKRAPVRCAM